MANNDAPRMVASLVFGRNMEAWSGPRGRLDPRRVPFWDLYTGDIPLGAVMPDPTSRMIAAANLEALGFRVEASTPVGLSFSGTQETFEALVEEPDVFALRGYVRPWSGSAPGNGADDDAPRGTQRGVEESEALLRTLLDGWRQEPSLPVRTGEPERGPDGSIQSNDLLRETSAIEFGVEGVSVSGTSRRNVLIGAAAVVAAGFAVGWCATRDDGVAPPVAIPTVPTDTRELRALLGLRDEDETGQGITVAVVDSGWEPPNGVDDPRVDVLEPPGGLARDGDPRGHGTAVIEHLLAVAPDVRVRVSKYVDNSGFRNFPVAAFQQAVWGRYDATTPTELPDIVLCSWVTLDLSVALQVE
ncbi:MAG: hypothetical protein AAF211_00190, partial [Myxococcota bacterium]